MMKLRRTIALLLSVAMLALSAGVSEEALTTEAPAPVEDVQEAPVEAEADPEPEPTEAPAPEPEPSPEPAPEATEEPAPEATEIPEVELTEAPAIEETAAPEALQPPKLTLKADWRLDPETKALTIPFATTETFVEIEWTFDGEAARYALESAPLPRENEEEQRSALGETAEKKFRLPVEAHLDGWYTLYIAALLDDGTKLEAAQLFRLERKPEETPIAPTAEPTPAPTENPIVDENPAPSVMPTEEPAPALGVRIEAEAFVLSAVVETQQPGEIVYRWQSLDLAAYQAALLAGELPDVEALWTDIPGATGASFNPSEALGEAFPNYGYRVVASQGDAEAASKLYKFDQDAIIDTLAPENGLSQQGVMPVGNVTISEEQIVAHANRLVGSDHVSGYCLEWLATKFWQALGAPYASSCCAWNFGNGRIVSTSRDNIPIGANVFLAGGSTKDKYGHTCGHIGVYVGDGKVLNLIRYSADGYYSNGNKRAYVRKNTIAEFESWGYTYRGWGYPDGVTITSSSSGVQTIAYEASSYKIIKACNIMKEPYAESGSSSSVKVGDTIDVVEVVKNKYNNIWLKTSTGAYIYGGYEVKNGGLNQTGGQYVQFTKDNSNIQITSANYPKGTLPAGKGFEIKGTLSSSNSLSKLEAKAIGPTNASSSVSFSQSQKVTNYDLMNSTFNTGIKFASLKSGSYRFVVTAYYYRDRTTQLVTKELYNGTFSIGSASGPTPPPADTKVNWISLNQSSLSLKKGEGATLTATISPSNATNKNVNWSSDRTTVATVSGGKVNAVGVGTAIITCTAADGSGVKATCEVTVTAADVKVSRIDLNLSYQSLVVGTYRQLEATVYPAEATNQKLSWSSNNTTVATVSQSGAVTTLSPGTAIITCAATDGSGVKATCEVYVYKVYPSVQSVTATPDPARVNEETSLSIVTTSDAEYLRLEVDGDVIYEGSAAKAKPTLAGTRKIWGLTATFKVADTYELDWSASADGIEYGDVFTKRLTVKEVEDIKISSIEFNWDQRVFDISDPEPYELETYIMPANATNKLLTWYSTDTDVATVDEGVITPVGVGEAAIVATATDGSDAFAVCYVTVVDSSFGGAWLSRDELTLMPGDVEYVDIITDPPEAHWLFENLDEYSYWVENENVIEIDITYDGCLMVQALEAGKTDFELTVYIDGEEVVFAGTVTVGKAPSKVTVPATMTLGVGEEGTLWATLPEGSASKLTASSSNAKIVSVEPMEDEPLGFVLVAKKTGTATITVKTHNGKKASCKVTVKKKPVAGKLNVSPKTLTLAVGQSSKLKASYATGFGGGFTWDVEPGTGWATVDEDGVVTAEEAGTVTVVATTYNGVSAQCKLTIEPEPDWLEVTANDVTLGVGETFALKPVAMCDDEPVTQAMITCTSSNKGVAAVGSKGKITAKKVGTAQITVETYNGLTETVDVTVRKAPGKVTLNATSKTLHVDDVFELICTLPANTASKLTVTSSNPKVVSVEPMEGDENAFALVANKAGSATITVKTFNGKQATCKITVKK